MKLNIVNTSNNPLPAYETQFEKENIEDTDKAEEHSSS